MTEVGASEDSILAKLLFNSTPQQEKHKTDEMSGCWQFTLVGRQSFAYMHTGARKKGLLCWGQRHRHMFLCSIFSMQMHVATTHRHQSSTQSDRLTSTIGCT